MLVSTISKPEAPHPRWMLFANTDLVTALNPRGVAFFVAFLSQFLSASETITPQLWILSSTFVVLAALNAGLYALFASTARGLLAAPCAARPWRGCFRDTKQTPMAVACGSNG